MTDVVSPAKRSEMMAGIKAKDTLAELVLRKELFRRGLRYRVHSKNLPGKPDMVFPRYRAVVFVNGCFWHGHECHLFKWPKTRPDFWREKISANRERDARKIKELLSAGWRVKTIWECSLKAKSADQIPSVVDSIEDWIKED